MEYNLRSFLEKISDYFENQTRPDGAIICPKHRIEHTGKNVYSAIIDSEFYKFTGEEKYFERAKKRVFRTIENLIQDPEHGGWIFWPGRLDGRNMSNSVIDSGASTDSLATFFLEFGNKLNENEKEKIKDAIFKNCDAYLKTACVEKEITNQRLWGATGLASAYRVFKKDDWKIAVLRSIEKSFEEMWFDGTFPYHPNYKDYGIFRGINDTTPFYHSRCIAFIYYALESMGESFENYKEKLIKATDLLLGFYQEDGVKNINLETKRWYFLSDYEIASNVYDVYAFLKTYQLTKNKIYFECAKKSLDWILKHQLNDGGIIDHFGTEHNFQCRIFWNANCAWLAKIADSLHDIHSNILENVGMNQSVYLKHFDKSDIVKFKNQNYACILRGVKQPQNVVWGPRVGGGSLLYFGRKENNWRNEIKFEEWGSGDPPNFYLEAKLPSQGDFWAENKGDLRALIYYIKVELKTRNFKTAWLRIKDLFRKIWKRNKDFASHFSGEVKTLINKAERKVVFEVVPTRRNGEKLEKAALKREYVFDEKVLKIKEVLEINNSQINNVIYNKHSLMKNLKINSDAKFKESVEQILFYSAAGKAEINFEL